MFKLLILAFAIALSSIAKAAPVRFTNLAGDFDTLEAQTHALPMPRRVAAFRAHFDRRLPGLYDDPDSARLDHQIAKALAEFPPTRPAYRAVQRRFEKELSIAVRQLRAIFPRFASPLPIYLTHQLGVRDGGSAYVHGRKVMLFGADVIAGIHNDESLRPFIVHELFHLEHARHFADCDQLWCLLWQEGLATYAAAVMTPGATDHQLLLDQPAPIRAATDARWPTALCRIAASFDSTNERTVAVAFSSGDSTAALPSRFGYYIGLRIAQQTAKRHDLSALTRMSNQTARPVVTAALTGLIADVRAPCQPPAASGSITHQPARSA